jgi:hypothetical protein
LVDHRPGSSTESGSKISTAQKKKKSGSTTRKGKGKAKATDGQHLSRSSQIISQPSCQVMMSQKQKQPKSNLLQSVEDGHQKQKLKLVI